MTDTCLMPRHLSVNRRIFVAAGSVAVAGAVVKIASTCKEVVVAGIYGRSDAMDAFLAAFLIPNLLVNLIAESMNQALIPTLIRVKIHEGQDRARQLFSAAMISMSGQLLVASLGMAVLARAAFPLIASGFSSAKLDLSVHMFYGLLPLVVLTGIASSCTAVLNTLDRFAMPALSQLVVPVSIVAGTLLLNGRCGIWALVYTTVSGAFLHAALVVWMLNRGGYRPRLERWGNHSAALEVSRQYLPVLLSSVIASAGLLVDQAMAAMLPAGSVSALVFANRFVSVIVTLMAGAIASAITPYISGMIAQREWRQCRRTLRAWSWRMAGISTSLSVLLIAGAQPLVHLTLQHGAFGQDDTKVVKTVLVMYAIQIPFFVVSRVYYRFVVAMCRTDIVLYCGILNFSLDVALNLIFMRRFGVAGIALATSCWSASTLLFLWYWAKRLLASAERPTAQSFA